jgi:hypothetical protein
MKHVVFKPLNMTSDELVSGIQRMYAEFYSTPYTIQRIASSLKLGIFPFFMVFIRNFIANMNIRRLNVKN